MTLKWKRRFYATTDYQSVNEMLDDAMHSLDARMFLECCLGLRKRKEYRHTVDEVLEQRRLGERRKCWYKPLMRTILQLYRTERALVTESRRREAGHYRSMSRRQRAGIAVPGVLMARRRPTKKIAAENRAIVATKMRVAGGIVWMDNFNKFRYARNVNEERNRCINGTVMSVLPLANLSSHHWTGWSPLSALVQALPGFAALFGKALRKISNEVKTLQQNPLSFEQVRVPCDVRRVGVRNLGWMPWMVYGENVGSTSGMVVSLSRLLAAQRVVGKLMPIIVDVNVYYRLLKLLYHKSLMKVNLRGAMSQHPLLFGLWHAYAHCVKRTFAVFKLCWSALEYTGFVQFPEATTIYLKPHLDVLEQMIVAMYLVHYRRQTQLESLVAQCAADFGAGSRIHRVAECLQLLVTVYAPSLFGLGMSVRECYWMLQQPNTGARVRDLLCFCLGFLLALEKSEKTEYTRVLLLAILTWSPFLSSLPAAAFVEEVMEASLSRLGRFCATDLRRHSVNDFSDAFASLGPSRPVADLVNPHIAATLPDRVLMRLDKCIAALKSGRFPALVVGGIKAVGAPDDATGTAVYVPRSPLKEPDVELVNRSINHAMLTLLDVDDLDPQLLVQVKDCAVGVPALPDAVVDACAAVHDAAVDRLRKALRRTPSRRRPATGAAAASAAPQPPVPAVDVPVPDDEPEEVSSQTTVLQHLPSVLSAADDIATSSFPATTDSSFYSSQPTSASTLSDAGSFSSDDSRSPACTSGSDTEPRRYPSD